MIDMKQVLSIWTFYFFGHSPPMTTDPVKSAVFVLSLCQTSFRYLWLDLPSDRVVPQRQWKAL